MTELLKCRCGGTPKIYEYAGSDFREVDIKCPVCRANTGKIRKDHAIEIWNDWMSPHDPENPVKDVTCEDCDYRLAREVDHGALAICKLCANYVKVDE